MAWTDYQERIAVQVCTPNRVFSDSSCFQMRGMILWEANKKGNSRGIPTAEDKLLRICWEGVIGPLLFLMFLNTASVDAMPIPTHWRTPVSPLELETASSDQARWGSKAGWSTAGIHSKWVHAFMMGELASVVTSIALPQVWTDLRNYGIWSNLDILRVCLQFRELPVLLWDM